MFQRERKYSIVFSELGGVTLLSKCETIAGQCLVPI